MHGIVNLEDGRSIHWHGINLFAQVDNVPSTVLDSMLVWGLYLLVVVVV